MLRVLFIFIGEPSRDPSHPDFTPSVFAFNDYRKKTPNRTAKYERVKRRNLSTSLSSLFALETNQDRTVYNEAAQALLDLSSFQALVDKGTLKFRLKKYIP